MKHKFLNFFIVCVVVVLVGCDKYGHNNQLECIHSIISDKPQEALDSLGCINYNNLSSSDKCFYDFLTIKAKDKAYIIHTNDSVYINVLNFYSKRKDSNLYPEILYYGGRIYSDMGDYPVAIQYYQQALELLPPNTKNISLRVKVVSQTGRLLNSLRLYDDAISNIKEVVDIEKGNKDSINLVYDLQLLGAIYINTEKYDSAEYYIKQSRDLAKKVSPVDTTQNDIYLSTIYSKTNKHYLAKKLIRSIFNSNYIEDKDNALANAAGVYYRAEVYDTAFLYAHKIIKLRNSNNIRYALHLALTPELIKYVSVDSLQSYVSLYQKVTEDEFKKNSDNQTLIQNSLYNYKIHDRERAKKEKENVQLKMSLYGVAIIIIFLITVIFYLKYRNKRNLLKLYGIVSKLQFFHKSIDELNSSIDIEKENQLVENISASDLKERIQSELIVLQRGAESKSNVREKIQSSDLYKLFQTHISSNDCIPSDSSIWDEVEKLVVCVDPSFMSKLRILANGELKTTEKRMILLIRCGLKPTFVAILMAKDKGTITYHRNKLSLRLFGQKMGTKEFDNAICSL